MRTAGTSLLLFALLGAARPAFGADTGALSAPSRANLARASAALDRFQDPAVARREGYVKPWRNDGFQMGEHWFHPDLLRAGRCQLERPAFLQYLVVEGARRLVGTGYVCDAAAGPANWFGADAAWHTHGPELCVFQSGAILDASYLARAVPNERNDATWQELCRRVRATPTLRPVVMLHTWNWVPAPDGPLVHENRAIPFLRAGLRVPSRAELDGETGRAALATLRLAQGDVAKRYGGALALAGLGFLERFGPRAKLRAGERAARRAVTRMRDAERAGDDAAYAAAAREGAQALRAAEHEVAEALDPAVRPLVSRILASFVVHDHSAPGGADAHDHAHHLDGAM